MSAHESPRSRLFDPDDPWRWACPECGSASIKHQEASEERLECNACHWCGVPSELLDRRETLVPI
jgi:predicted RNA-binding Zn-ribbon protein involved in translation (DUF1610 family)